MPTSLNAGLQSGARLPASWTRDAAAAINNLANREVPLSVYGILPDTGADLTASIQAVIDANPNRDVLFDRPGVYLVNTVTTNTVSWCLSVTRDNTYLRGVPGAELKTTQDAAVVFFAGPARNGAGFASWQANRFYPNLTVYTMTGPIAKGATSITLATAAQAANFAAGDLIFVRTGNLGSGADNFQPDAEINEVLTASGGTGIITLRYPLAKPYAQEYFISGTSGLTSTSVTANPAPFGVSNVTAYTLRNVGVRGLDLTSTTGNPWHAFQCFGFELADAVITTAKDNGNPYYLRKFAFRRLRIRCTDAATPRWLVPLGATGQVDGVAEDVDGVSAGVGFMHLHEGGADLTAQRVRLRSTAALATQQVVSIRGRGYDLKVLDSKFWQTGTAACVFADSGVTGGLIFDGNEVYAETADAVAFAGANQVFGPNNRILKGAVSFWNAATGAAVVGGTAPQRVEILSQWASDDNQNPALGTLPANCYLLRAHLHVQQAFDSSGTDLIRCGYDAADTSVFADVDVSTTGIKAVTLGALAGYNATARDLEIYYANGGTEPTTGRALVIVEYVRCARQVT